MTREEALRDCKTCIHSYKGKCAVTEECHECMWESKYEQQPCEDCISRAEAIEALGYDISIESDEGLDAYRTVIKEMLCKIYDVQKENIEKLPSIQPKPKMGHWIGRDASGTNFYGKCSCCGQEIQIDAWYTQNMNYCPNCGAKMLPTDLQFGDQDTLMSAT